MNAFPKKFADGWDEYELIDAGGGKKLERWGKVITIRPEVQAYFKSGMPFEKWNEIAHWEFRAGKGATGTWKKVKGGPKQWTIKYNRLVFNLELTAFKHVGLFPEQNVNWDYIINHISADDKFLNLFAYTGAASLAARYTGAEVLHVDSVKQLVSWANANQESSRLLNTKWVVEDALKFAKREVKRGNKYQGIIMDPPAWGLGAKGEKWKLEEKIDELLAVANELMTEDGFVIVNTYSPQVDAQMLHELASMYFQGKNVQVQGLWMKTTTGKEMYFGDRLLVS